MEHVKYTGVHKLNINACRLAGARIFLMQATSNSTTVGCLGAQMWNICILASRESNPTVKDGTLILVHFYKTMNIKIHNKAIGCNIL